MKRLLTVLLTVVLVFGLTACGGPKVSDKAMSCGVKALEAADGYLDKSIDAKEAVEMLDTLKEDMAYVDDMSHDDKNKAGDFAVSVDILVLSTSILSDSIKSDDETYSKVKDARKNLADDIGKK